MKSDSDLDLNLLNKLQSGFMRELQIKFLAKRSIRFGENIFLHMLERSRYRMIHLSYRPVYTNIPFYFYIK